MKFTLILALFCINIASIISQENLITNGSFEANKPKMSHVPAKWLNMGDEGNSPPDIHGKHTRYYRVKHKAPDGKNYLGLVVRPDGTNEVIGQLITEPIDTGVLYEISFLAAMSKEHINVHLGANGRLLEGVPQRLDEPAAIRISVANYIRRVNQPPKIRPIEIYRSGAVEQEEWHLFMHKFVVKGPYDFLIIEVIHLGSKPYYGNVLIDDIQLMKIE